jgi:Tol biopolymer transport system component
MLEVKKPSRLWRVLMMGGLIFLTVAILAVVGFGGLKIYQRFRPIGGRIAYKTENIDGTVNLWVMKPDGSDKVMLVSDAVGIDYPSFVRYVPPFSIRTPFSPTGEKLAFAVEMEGKWNLYTVRADGTDEIVLFSEVDSVKWEFSPDGRRIGVAVREEGLWSLYVIDAITGKEVALVRDADNIRFHLSPDGEKIAFLPMMDGGWSIYLSNLDGTERVTIAEEMEDARLAFSPDGSKIIYATKEEGRWGIYTANPDGSELAVIAKRIYYLRSFRFSPDNRRIILSLAPREAMGLDLYLLNADGTEKVRLVKGMEQAGGFFLSRDKVLFIVSKKGEWRFYTVDDDGSNKATLARDVDQFSLPLISPDTKRVILPLWRRGKWEIRAFDFDGENQVTLLKGVDDLGDIFVTDRKIVFSAEEEGKWGLYVADVVTGEKVQLVSDVDELRGYDYSPEGRKIVFGEVSLGISKLYTINPDGSGKAKLADEGYEPIWSKR